MKNKKLDRKDMGKISRRWTINILRASEGQIRAVERWLYKRKMFKLIKGNGNEDNYLALVFAG